MNNENSLQIFNNSELGKVRTIVIDGEPYLVGKDVADVLGYVKAAKMYDRLDDDEMKTTTLQFGASWQKAVIINESGFYNAVIGSKKPIAKRFKKWITSEVLPSIRKTGSYSVDGRRADGWGSTRIKGKEVRKELTYYIAEFVEYAKKQGSKGGKWYYANITSACNNALFGVKSLSKIKKNLRDEVDVLQLSRLSTLEDAIKKRLIDLLEETPRRSYKEIYNELKKVCIMFESLLGISKPAYITDNEYYICLPEKRKKQLKNTKIIKFLEKGEK